MYQHQSKLYYDQYINTLNQYTNNHTIRQNQSIPITLYHQNISEVKAKHGIKIYQAPTVTSNIVTYTKFVDCPTFESNTVQQSFNFDGLQGADYSVDGTLTLVSPEQPLPGDPFTTHSDALHVFEIISCNKTNINDSLNMYDITYRKKAIESVEWFKNTYRTTTTKYFARELNSFLDENHNNMYNDLYTNKYQTSLTINAYEHNDLTDFLIREISKGTSTHTLRFVDREVGSVDILAPDIISESNAKYPVLYALYTLEKRRS